MIVLELFAVSLVIGVALGVAWRVAENWWEKRTQ